MSKASDDFEKEVIERLRNREYWAIRLPASIGGQPFDILALPADIDCDSPIAVECKLCCIDRFDLRRIEPNQMASMLTFEKYGNMYFAIRFKSGVRILSLACIRMAIEEGKKSINYNDYTSHLTEEWGF